MTGIFIALANLLGVWHWTATDRPGWAVASGVAAVVSLGFGVAALVQERKRGV